MNHLCLRIAIPFGTNSNNEFHKFFDVNKLILLDKF